MDNVTHTLAGLVLAEAVVQWRARRSGEAPSTPFVRAAYFTSAAANNLPDLDFAYTWITGGKLGYLLHHRGHTHTLAVAVPLGLAFYAALVAWLRRRRDLPKAEVRTLLALSAIGPIVHIGMDASNIYGVHPFWPLYDGWLYGDSVFIVEPLFWITTLPALIFAVKARVGRSVLGVLLGAIVALAWLTDFVPHWLAIALTLATAGMLLLSWRLSRPGRALSAVVGSGVVLALFVASGTAARERIAGLSAAAFPGAVTHDIALTPLPANPTCWSAITVQTQGDALVLRRALVAPFNALVDLDRCPALAREGTATTVPVTGPGSVNVRWQAEVRVPLTRLTRLSREHCEVAAFLRFARAPFIVERGTEIVAGDLRFDREKGLGFAELSLGPAPTDCPRFVPPWLPPRGDVVGGGSLPRP